VTPQEWQTCRDPEAMLRFAATSRFPRELLVLTACRLARLLLRFVPRWEKRPQTAIETAERWARGGTTLREVEIARRNVAKTTYDPDAYPDQNERAQQLLDASDAFDDGNFLPAERIEHNRKVDEAHIKSQIAHAVGAAASAIDVIEATPRRVEAFLFSVLTHLESCTYGGRTGARAAPRQRLFCDTIRRVITREDLEIWALAGRDTELTYPSGRMSRVTYAAIMSTGEDRRVSIDAFLEVVARKGGAFEELSDEGRRENLRKAPQRDKASRRWHRKRK